MAGKNIVIDKSFSFSLRIVNAYKFLTETKHELLMSKQLLRSGTAIGALLSEAEYAQSKPDFISKNHIALKEANETKYWIELLGKSEYFDKIAYESLLQDVIEIIKLLTAILVTSKKTAV